MYLDTDVVLALLKVDDWLKSEVPRDALEDPVTSAATSVEVQYAMQDDWSRQRLSSVTKELKNESVEIASLRREDVEAAEQLRRRYSRLGVFDSVHLAAAWTRDLQIVSTDSLYPSIEEVEHVDPRELRRER